MPWYVAYPRLTMGTAGAPDTDDIHSPKTARFRARSIAVLGLGLNLSLWGCRAVFIEELDAVNEGLLRDGYQKFEA
jgi:hypothetical protein